MKKIIKRRIRISTRTRDFVDYVNHEFYSHDKHNAFFEFTMEQLPTENIIGLFYFQKTKRYLEKRATVEGNTFTIEFDTSLITTDETVIGFIYFEKVVQSADVHQFSFGVKVSEIDKMQDVPIQEESTKRIVSLEDIVTKAELKELFKTIERNGESTPIDTSNFATAKSVEAIEERVRTIESKEDHDTIYNDEEIKRRLDTLESKTDNFISGVSVNKEGNNVTLTYNYVDGQTKNVSFTDSDTINIAYDDSALKTRLNDLENRPQIDVSELAKKTDIPQPYNDSELSRRVSALETKDDKDTVYNDEEIKRRLDTLESKTDNFVSGVSVSKESNNVTLTYTYVDGSSKNVSFTDSDTINVAYDDSALRERLTALENKSSTDSNIDVKNLVTRDELEKKEDIIYDAINQNPLYTTYTEDTLTEHLKGEDNSAITNVDVRGGVIYSNSTHTTADIFKGDVNKEKFVTFQTAMFTLANSIPDNYSVSELLYEGNENNKVIFLSNKNFSEVVPKEQLKAIIKEVGGTDYSKKIADLEAKAGYEIHGTGMPNGQVKAPIGTTYVDMEVTNGALKWIKRTGTGNTGWQVFTGDTGWRTLPLEQKRGTARLQIRRINDQVIVKFDGLQWGWFGVNDIEKLGGSVVEKTIGGKKYTWIKLSVGRGVYVLPDGFRSASSLLSGLYGDLGDLLGSVYVGGTADSNAIQLRYAMERNALTSNILSQIRISPITFITDDDWPTTLP